MSNNGGRKAIGIVMAEDDPDDRLLTREAMEESHLLNSLDFVEDGVELFEYLRREGKYAELKGAPLPGVILLDLNMPRMDGREALEKLKQDPVLKKIPVVILTTSKAEEDILQSYDLGVSSYIMKPVTFEGMVRVMMSFSDYWFQIVTLPDLRE